MVLGLQRWVLYPRYAAAPDPHAGEGIEGLERWSLSTPEGEVEAWLVPGDGATADDPGPAVIYAHGNAELIDYWPETLRRYREWGVTLLLPEYRGYGRSDGSPSQEKITADFEAFYDRLAARPEVDEDRIIFHGRSLGGGAVCALARRRKPAAMILMSTFTSVADMAKRYLLPRFLVLDPFDNEQVLRELDVPVLLVHGTEDELVPHASSERLAKIAPRAELVSYPCDHNTCPHDWERFWRDVRHFLEATAILRTGTRSPLPTH